MNALFCRREKAFILVECVPADIIIDLSFFSFFVQIRKALVRPFKSLPLSSMSEIEYTFHYPLQIMTEYSLSIFSGTTMHLSLIFIMYVSGVFGHNSI
jgi:hypothetical protein